MENLTKAEKKEIRKKERQEWEEKLNREEKLKIYKKIGIWIAITLGSIVALWTIISIVNGKTTTTNSIIMPPLNSQDISIGNPNSKVTLVEYADFQCPTCGLYHPILKQLLKDFEGKLRLIYRFFPLPTLHQNAVSAAKAAYAAKLQGKFWLMHDMLFEHQKDWAENNNAKDIFTGYAKTLGLDLDKFKIDYEADSTQKFIDNQSNIGTQAGIQGTPTFFLNGKQIENPRGYEPFKNLIQSKL